MTVPTNNKEAEATAEQKAWDELARLTSGSGPAVNWKWSIPANPDRDSDLILAAGLKAVDNERDALAAILAARRPPVSVDNLKAAAIEAERIITEEMSAEAITGALPFKVGFVEGAEWQASQPREVEVTMRTVEWGLSDSMLDSFPKPHFIGSEESVRRNQRKGHPAIKVVSRTVSSWLPVTPSTPNQQGAEHE